MTGARGPRVITWDLFWRLVLIEIPIMEDTRMLRVFAMDYITHTSNLDRVGLLRPSYVL